MVTDVGTYKPLVERRAGYRYPVSLDLSYRDLTGKKVTGQGTTINISSSGILFAAEHPLPVHTNVELMLRWPVLLDNEVPLQLRVNGKVMRSDGTRAAIEILQYEFRISARRARPDCVSILADASA